MNKDSVNKKEELEFDAQDKKIYDAFIELGWLIPQTEEDVQRAEKALEDIRCPPLPNGLSNPSKILEKIRKRKEISKNAEKENSQSNNLLELSPTLLSLLRQASKMLPSEIAQRLKVTIAFMRGCSDFPDSIPEQCKLELIERAFREFNFIDKSLIENVVRNPKQVATAGFRDNSYSGKRMSFEEIVEKSGMDEVYKKFWLDLAKGE